MTGWGISADATMISRNDQYSEDIFAETRMSFGEHIDDLRTHLIRALWGFAFFVVISFFPFIGKNVLRFIAQPVEVELNRYWQHYYEQRSAQVMKDLREGDKELQALNKPIDVDLVISERELARLFNALNQAGGKKEEARGARGAGEGRPFQLDPEAAVAPILRDLGLEDWLEPDNKSGEKRHTLHAKMNNALETAARAKTFEPFIGRRPQLATLNVQEAFVVYLKVCLMTGFVLASPWVFFQLWSFVAAGLYPHEKRYVNLYLPFSIGLFLIGVFLCEWIVIPKAVEALLWFNEWLGLEPQLRLNEWLGFAIFMPLLFGISFQTPLVMLFIQRMGVLTVEAFRRGRRMAFLLLTIFAAVAVPSTDVLSILFLLIPMCLLYELGIWLCLWVPRRPELDIEVPESEEMVEV
jgi:sec-independent protein translocase protein TatC